MSRFGPCMCGDTGCPSCGPAQGYDPVHEQVCEWIQETLLAGFPEVINVDWLAGELANRFIAVGGQEFIDAVEREARQSAKVRR